MPRTRALTWIAAVVFAPILLAVLFVAIFGWNWLRGPIERMALDKTGRALVIQGDLQVKPGWPLPRIRAHTVTFANPAWATEPQMIAAEAVELTVDLPQLLARNLVLPEVRLERPVVFLEQGSEGRKNWLLDLEQQDEGARIRIGRLTLDQGILGYDDAGKKTRIRSDLSTTSTQPDGSSGPGLTFRAQGKYQGLAFRARGSGGPVLAMRDERTPYPLKVDAAVGRTRVRAEGTVTSLLKFSAVDIRLALSGDSLEQLYPLLGFAFPPTGVYATEGHLRHAGNTWRYEKFSGRIGDSDIAGTFQVDTGGERPLIEADLVSKLLDIADLGPLIGARRGSVKAAAQAAPPLAQTAALAPARVLPDLPFNTYRWNSVDANVKLSARTIRRAKELPLEDLVARMRLRDSVLTLDPLNFGVAGGQLNAVISLDGRKDPIQAHAHLGARKLRIAKLLPTVELNKASIGEVNGEFILAGQGNSVGRMLATSNGRMGLFVASGEISRLMMEKAGLHLWEILVLTLVGDRPVKFRCGVADFEVRAGTMRASALIFDTEITTIAGTGSIDLGQEKLDLTLNQNTKITSPVALRSPIYVRGSFAKPVVEVDKRRMAARALGALGLGLVNPMLTLIPLVDPGPGKDSDCTDRVRDAKALPRLEYQKTSPRR